MKRTSSAGFTTQEILPIFALIVILAGILLIPLACVKKKVLERRAHAATNQVVIVENKPAKAENRNPFRNLLP